MFVRFEGYFSHLAPRPPYEKRSTLCISYTNENEGRDPADIVIIVLLMYSYVYSYVFDLLLFQYCA